MKSVSLLLAVGLSAAVVASSCGGPPAPQSPSPNPDSLAELERRRQDSIDAENRRQQEEAERTRDLGLTLADERGHPYSRAVARVGQQTRRVLQIEADTDDEFDADILGGEMGAHDARERVPVEGRPLRPVGRPAAADPRGDVQREARSGRLPARVPATPEGILPGTAGREVESFASTEGPVERPALFLFGGAKLPAEQPAEAAPQPSAKAGHPTPPGGSEPSLHRRDAEARSSLPRGECAVTPRGGVAVK